MEIPVGSVTLDVPRSVGYYGGVALTVVVGVIEPPLGAVIAAVPLLTVVDGSKGSYPRSKKPVSALPRLM
jgi:hypothetical protein